MKKITAIMGNANSEFERQMKDLLNELSDRVEDIYSDQRNAKPKYPDNLARPLFCDLCQEKADIMTTDLVSGSCKHFCNGCLLLP
jgi:hypothetical protein